MIEPEPCIYYAVSLPTKLNSRGKKKFNYSIYALFKVLYIINTSEKRVLRARISALFIAVTFENYEQYFFYEILVLIKSKNINVAFFDDITTIFIIEKVV